MSFGPAARGGVTDRDLDTCPLLDLRDDRPGGQHLSAVVPPEPWSQAKDLDELPAHAVLCRIARRHVVRAGHPEHGVGGAPGNADDHIGNRDRDGDRAGRCLKLPAELAEYTVSARGLCVLATRLLMLC